MTVNIANFANIIKYHRKEAKLTQNELAKLARVGKTVVFDLEKGKVTIRLNSLVKVLDTLNITLDWNSPLKKIYSHKQNGAS